MPNNGKRATVSTIIPIPPIQWVILLQNKIPGGNDSMSEKMVAPVVVNPETDSKKASTKLVVTPESIKGNAPKKPRKIQPIATIRYPSLLLTIVLVLNFENHNNAPETIVIPPEIKKSLKSLPE
jgi:hypothetical protein